MNTENTIEVPSQEGPWKNLINDILTLILKRLNTQSDLCRFRSICKSWRSFATPIQSHLLFPITLPSLHPHSRSFSLSPILLYIFSPQNTIYNHNNIWLTKVSETGMNKWALLNPLTKHKLYFDSSSKGFKDKIDLLGFRNYEVGRCYRLQLVKDDGGNEDRFDFEEFSSSIELRKVVVCIGEKVSVLGLYGYGEIAVWNSGDERWKIETRKNDKRNDFDDVICFNDKFYAVDRRGRLVIVDPMPGAAVVEVVEVVSPSEEFNGHYTYLVESNYRLYLVYKIVNPRPTNYYDYEEEEWVVDKSCVGRPLGFRVFVLNERGKCWDKVTSLENKVFFVSRDATFSIKAEDFGWSKGNCIYFEGLTGYDDEADMSFGLNAGVYNLEDEAITIFDSSVDHWTRYFWPPSNWFVQNDEYPECEMQDLCWS